MWCSFTARKYYQSDDPSEEPIADDGAAEIIVSKQRNGPVGTVEVEWQDEFARFINPAGRPGSLLY